MDRDAPYNKPLHPKCRMPGVLHTMNNQVIAAAQKAMRHRIADGSVSDHTRNSSTVTKAWMKYCWNIDSDRYRTEISVHPTLNQRIDVLDAQEMVAYEFKVSGKNATAEFYKDIVKVILWNEENDKKIEKLIFITEELGRRHLDAPMPQAFAAYLRRSGLEVEVAYVKMKGVV